MTLDPSTDQGRNLISILAALPVTAIVVALAYNTVNFLV